MLACCDTLSCLSSLHYDTTDSLYCETDSLYCETDSLYCETYCLLHVRRVHHPPLL